MHKLKKILFAFIAALLGAVFIFSAYTKLLPFIEPFEYTFVDLGLSNWRLAPFIARILIGLEFLIGGLLLLSLHLKKFTYKLGIITLLVFCVYLLLQLIMWGNGGNCGCFGTEYYMSPAKALLKNVAMLVLFAALYFFYDGFRYGKFSVYITTLVIIASFALPFILNPVELNYGAAYLHKPQTNNKLELDTLYKNAYIHSPSKELSKGKHVILFLSLTCSHCRVAAKKINTMHKKNAALPFYMVLNGKEDKLKPFFDDTHAENIDYCLLKGTSFTYLAGVVLPTIYLVNNGMVEYQVNYIELDQQEIENWLSKP